jgi:hypothetical protein
MTKLRENSDNSNRYILGYYIVSLIDVLGQSHLLDDWGEIPSSNQIPKELLGKIKRTAGTVVALGDLLENWFESVSNIRPAGCGRTYEKWLTELAKSSASVKIEIQQFGDTFVFYAPLAESPGRISLVPVFGVLSTCCMMLRLSLSAGVPLRGSVAIGPAIELAKRTIYGPALAKAYKLESSIAKSPRIVVSEEVSQLVNETANTTSSSELRPYLAELAKYCHLMLTTDSDGIDVVDYMGPQLDTIFPKTDEDTRSMWRAFTFSIDQFMRYRRQGDTKLVEKYPRTVNYMLDRIRFWISSDE